MITAFKWAPLVSLQDLCVFSCNNVKCSCSRLSYLHCRCIKRVLKGLTLCLERAAGTMLACENNSEKSHINLNILTGFRFKSIR